MPVAARAACGTRRPPRKQAGGEWFPAAGDRPRRPRSVTLPRGMIPGRRLTVPEQASAQATFASRTEGSPRIPRASSTVATRPPSSRMMRTPFSTSGRLPLHLTPRSR